MKGPITGLRKWPELGSDWGRAVRPSCQIWPCPEKSTLVSRQKGRKLFLGRRWGAENLVEQEMVETPQRAWTGMESPLQTPALQPSSQVPPSPAGDRREATMPAALCGKL